MSNHSRIAERIALYDQITRYRALLRGQTDERACNVLRDMIRELEERIDAPSRQPGATDRDRPKPYRRPPTRRGRDREDERRTA